MPRGDEWPGRPAPVVVFDLDDTILRVNSFPHWVMFLIGGRIPGMHRRARALLSLRAALLLTRRKLGRLRHAALLRGLQRAWQRAAPPAAGASMQGLQTALLRRVRPNLQAVLALVAADRIDAVLATAAAADYALGLGQLLGFRHVVATVPAEDNAPINVGSHKRDAVFALLERQGWAGRPLILLTDHLDDLPLMRESAFVGWFGRSDDATNAAAAVSPVHLLACLELSGAALLAALPLDAALAPQAPAMTLS